MFDIIVRLIGDCRERWRTACVKVGAGYYECRACSARCEGRKVPGARKAADQEIALHGLLLCHTRHTAVRNMVDSGLEKMRAKSISGHITDATFGRYNIGKEADVEHARKTIERYHRAEQQKA